MAEQYLQFESVDKVFPGVKALQDVSFGVSTGSVHALLGENGAGKSTLLKVLSGVYKPDGGRLLLDGVPQTFHSTMAAIRAGIAVIYQELHLAPELSVAENLYLGHLPATAGWVDKRELVQDTIKQLQMLGEDISPKARLGSLSIGQRQMVEIAKALSREASVIAFDEPTSSLSSRETDKLFAVIRRFKEQGKAILYVSHRMDEIYEVCDCATVLRDGRHVTTFQTLQDVGRDLLVQKMVGRKIEDVFHYTPRVPGEMGMEVTGLIGPGLSQPASFSVRKGEILGFFGLVGAGRTELMKLIYGAVPPMRGSISVHGRPLQIRRPSDAIGAGIVLCPEDRKREGIIPIASVMDNLNLSARKRFSGLGFFIRDGKERQNASDNVARLAIKTPSLRQPIKNLSGGNQQKVILARWLGTGVKVVLLDEPTRGIDVGAKSEIYSIIYRLAENGVAVVMVSSELPEVLGVCDRIAVMREGSIVAFLDRDEATQEKVLSLALPAGEDTRRREAV